MIDELEFKRWLQRITKNSGSRIEQSSVFLSIYTIDYEREPQCALELGIAVLLDKPIYLLAPEGLKVAENVQRLARGLERYEAGNSDSLEAATKRLVKFALGEKR